PDTEPEADPAQVELARKFQTTERQVKALRQQYQNGTITRDQLQEQLRQHLILDTDDNWWMMGVDTDTWYRYDNASKQWVVAEPPVSRTPQRGVPTATSEFTPSDVLQGQLPYLPEDEEESQATAQDTSATRGTEPYYADADMPLPRTGVPITDPYATIPGNAAINQNTIRMSDAQTLDGGFGAEPTLKGTPVETTPYEPAFGYETVAAAPPAYDDLDEESRTYQQAVERQQQSNLRRLLLVATLFIGGAFIVGTLLVLYTVISYNNIASQYTDQIAALANYQPDFETVRVLDAAGNLLAELNSEQGGSRESVKLAQMSPELIFAIVGAEDPRYYETSGFDALTIADAFLQSLRGGTNRNADPNYTITQEIANRLVVANSPNADRATRLDVIVAASEIARKYDKNFILELYLNEQFFGNQSYGVQAASEFYFDKPATQDNLTEGAMLAALLRNPIDNDPVPKENRERAFAAADTVLRELAAVGCLNFQHAQFATSGPFCVQQSQLLKASGDFSANVVLQRGELQTLPFRPRSVSGKYPHFVDFVRRELTREYGDDMFRRGFRVRTTLISDLQDVAEKTLRDQLRAQAFTGLQTGAVMVVNPATGEIMAMVGSPDFNNAEIDGQTNYAFTWQLPGATILPLVYTRALEGIGDVNSNGQVDYNEYLTPATVLFDVPRDFQDPRLATTNADGQFRGAVSLRQALANSINVAAVKVFDFVGSERYVDIARRMGLTFLNEPPVIDPRTGIGQVTEVRLWDMMKAYSVLANTGQYVPLRAISEIRDSDDQVVPLTDSLTPRQANGVVSPSTTFLIQNILSDAQYYDALFAPLFLENYPSRTAVKINQINDNRDMWAIGFSRNAVVGVWMGRPDNNTTVANSRDAALPIWRTIMDRALAGTNPLPFNTAPANIVQPGSVQSIVICAPTGTLPSDSCTQQRNEFFAITNPPPPPDYMPVVSVQVDSWTRLIANEFCNDNVVTDQFVRVLPSDPGAIAWLNSQTGRPTANRMGLPQNVQPVPTAACDLNTDLPTARIVSPTAGSTVTGNVSILGVATANSFDSYQLEYAPVGGSTFTIITSQVRTQQPNQNGTLGEWNTTVIPNGQYTLRLTMFSRSGGFVRRDVNVTVLNPTPTPLPPTPTFTPPPVSISTATTVPLFPTPFSADSQAVGAATPTATLVIGG
ncbi:MAG: transglycosylase domain-containing protein, partial [Anaerolineae bacterium]|nr:transglycosylase domain-containing protein [Anaerolineae bacterium]